MRTLLNIPHDAHSMVFRILGNRPNRFVALAAGSFTASSLRSKSGRADLEYDFNRAAWLFKEPLMSCAWLDRLARDSPRPTLTAEADYPAPLICFGKSGDKNAIWSFQFSMSDRIISEVRTRTRIQGSNTPNRPPPFAKAWINLKIPRLTLPRFVSRALKLGTLPEGVVVFQV